MVWFKALLLSCLCFSGMVQAEPIVRASFGHENDPSIKKAFDSYNKTGKMLDLKKPGFVTYAYDSRAYFPVECEPLHLCVIELEQGENINNIDVGDSANWMVSTSLVGKPEKGAYQISIKPKQYNLNTDLVVTTTKRAYNIGLVSKEGANTHAVSFYYPQEMLQAATQNRQMLKEGRNKIEQTTVSEVSISQLNFNYQLQGTSAFYKPIRVFDDGNKTFIEMPKKITHADLPIFYIHENGKSELVNYRYKRPYFIVDRLFHRGLLVSGKGRGQIRILIKNRHLMG